MKDVGYIIGEYDKYNSWDIEHKRFSFIVNDKQYAIFEVPISFQIATEIPPRMEYEENPETYRVYESMEAAMEYVRIIKKLN